MKKLLLAFLLIPVLCCCNSGEQGATSAGTDDQSRKAPLTDSDRIALMTDKVETLIDQYDQDQDPKLLSEALSVTDSLAAIDTTQQGRFYTTLTRAQLLARQGKMHEALRLQEQILSQDPDNFVRLQFYAGKCWIEGKQDSARYYAERAIAVCDRVIADSVGHGEAVDQAMLNKISVYQLIDDRYKAHEVNTQLKNRHAGDPSYQMTDDEFNQEFDAARESFNQSASAYRNEKQ